MEAEELDLQRCATGVDTLEAYRAWVQRCDACLEYLRERCRRKRQRVSTGAVSSSIARLARLEGSRNALRQRFEPVGDGGGSAVEPEGLSWREIETAFTNRVVTGVVLNSSYIEPRRFLEDARDIVFERIREYLQRHSCLKVNTIFNGEFVTNADRSVKNLATKTHELFATSDLREWYDAHILDATLAALGEFQERDSGWALSRILNLTVNVNKYNPMHAGCWLKLPRDVQTKRAVVNVRSYDNACFAWSVVAALYPVEKNADRSSQYPHYSEVLRFDGIKFPVTLNHIARFEDLNDTSINVFTVREDITMRKKRDEDDDTTIVPLRLTKIKRDRHINLLYLQESRYNGHFAWIKNLSRLVGSQLSRHRCKKFICDRCLHYFGSGEKLEAHAVNCQQLNDCAIRLPSEDDKWLSFRNHDKKERLPFVVYADLECVLEKEEEPNNDEDDISRIAHQHHKAFSVGYYVCCAYDESQSMYRSYRGENCVSWFVEELHDLAHRVRMTLAENVAIEELTPIQREQFSSVTHCHICDKAFETGESRVLDHSHLTGRYRGPAHSRCNLNYKDSCVIPVFFHNLSGYDAHFIIKDVANHFEGQVYLLPLTKEKYISFTKFVEDTAVGRCRMNCVKLRFVDSFRFLNTGLEKLASYLDNSKLRVMRSEFRDLDAETFALLTRKGVFPYEYVDSVDRLCETALPPRESFQSSLTGEIVSTDEYEHAVNVWRRFDIETLGDYSDLYLKTDVLLLADIFENFRDTCMECYELDPAYYYTLPGYTWDAMLKHTGIRFELLTDIDMVLFVERGTRGGLSQCSNRYARANNKYAPSCHDPSAPSTYLMYLDVNNLYGWAMCESLPHGEFQWVDDVEGFDVMSVPHDSIVGYILEVDLEYPRSVHDAHADLPFCPTHERPPGKRNEKLLATLHDKLRYVTHYRNLQQCVRHGLRVMRIHRVLRFAQSPWLRGYIELNTRRRTLAANDFERNLYKLMNNAVFGKTLENVRNHVDVRLVTHWDGRYGAEALIAKPNFHSRSVFSENLVAIELRKLEVLLNKPIYVGMSILEISKTRLYEFHYEYAVPLYRDRCKIMYTDTDSLIYLLECDDAYENMKRDIARFDTSEYPERNVYDMPRVNAKIPGLMKDENNGAIMLEFVGLRAKMYATRVSGRSDTRKVKGVKRSVVARTISFDDYVRCLSDATEQSRRQSCIRSKLHEVYTISEVKLALSPYDDKRYIVPDSTATLPWGHYSITQ